MANLSNINNKLLVGTNGEVRIGDTATVANVKLRVKQTAQQWTAQFINTDSSVAYGISIDTSASSYGVAGTLQCYTNSGGGFIVRNDSKVGIGTASPGEKLDVDGNVKTTGAVKFYNSTSHYGSVYADSEGLNLDTVANRHMIFKKASVEIMRISTSGNVGIGDTSPSTKIDVYQSTGGIGVADFRHVNGNRILINPSYNYYDAYNHIFRGLSGTNTHMTIDLNGNVGIGTTAPASKLEVYGGTSGTNDVDRYVRFKASNGEKRFDFYMGGTGNASSLGMYTSDGTTKNVQISAGGTSYFNAGNVGIGTTSPDSKLEVITSGTNTVLELDNSDSNYTIIQYNASGATKGFSGFNAGFMLFGGEAGTTTRLQSGGSYAATILENGNFGIGTTTPSQKLDVNGNLAISGTTFVDSTRRNIYLNSSAAGGANGIFFRDGFTYNASITAEDHNGSFADGICISGYDGVSFSTGANTKNERMRIDVSGNVMMGKTSQSGNAALTVKSTAGSNTGIILVEGDTTNDGWGVYATTANKYIITRFTGGSYSDKFTILEGGNVGIGTTSPGEKLEVAGNVGVNGFITHNGDSGTFMGWSANDTNVFYTAGNERMRINPDGTTKFNANILVDVINNAANSANIIYRSGTDTIIGGGTASQKLTIADSGLATFSNNVFIAGDNTNTGYSRYLKLYGNSDPSTNVDRWAGLAVYNNGGNNVNELAFFTGSGDSSRTEKMRITSAGNVGIGTTSPLSTLDLGINGGQKFYVYANGSIRSGMGIDLSGSSRELSIFHTSSNNIDGDISLGLRNETSGQYVERMRVQGNGNVVIGSTTTPSRLEIRDSKTGSFNSPHLTIYGSGYGSFQWLDTDAYHIYTNSDGRDIEIICYANGVRLEPSATAWVSNSDISLKENIKPLENVLDKIKDYRCVEYNFKDDKVTDKKIGFIAQDWENDFSAVISKDKNDKLGIKYTETIPVLLKAIQELQARVKELENK